MIKFLRNTEGYYYRLRDAQIKQLMQRPATGAIERELSNMIVILLRSLMGHEF